MGMVECEMLSVNQIAGFLSFNISKTIGVDFFMQLHIC